jgi:hypothetical protein
MNIQALHPGSCHCGAVQFEVELPDGLVKPSRCNCSICRRKGAIVVAVPLAALHIRKGEDALTLYQFNTNTAKHYFCATCGIYTHHQRRSHPDQFSVNVGCLQDVNPFELDEVPVGDGIRHSCDR